MSGTYPFFDAELELRVFPGVVSVSVKNVFFLMRDSNISPEDAREAAAQFESQAAEIVAGLRKAAAQAEWAGRQ